MRLIALLDGDLRRMEAYLQRLFSLLEEVEAEEQNAPLEVLDAHAEVSQANHHSFSHLIRPDMAVGIYGLVEYWLRAICDHHAGVRLEKFKPQKGNQLKQMHDYLGNPAGVGVRMDEALLAGYQHLDLLREVRNAFVHAGGYVRREELRSTLNAREDIGIRMHGQLILIDEGFIRASMVQARSYLLGVARA